MKNLQYGVVFLYNTGALFVACGVLSVCIQHVRRNNAEWNSTLSARSRGSKWDENLKNANGRCLEEGENLWITKS